MNILSGIPEANMPNPISIRSIEFSYKSSGMIVRALSGIDLEVRKGHIFGFIGPNGAGKTTTIKLLLGIHVRQKGTIRIMDRDPDDPLSRISVGYMPEVANYYRFLTPMELLFMYGKMFGLSGSSLRKRSEQLLEMVGLADFANRQMRTFSKGMLQKASFAQALINDPELLVLDEPASGLDPVARHNMRKVIMGLREKGKTIFFSSHELSEVETICDRVAILNKGQIVASGSTDRLLQGRKEGLSLENYFLEMIGGGS